MTKSITARRTLIRGPLLLLVYKESGEDGHSNSHQRAWPSPSTRTRIFLISDKG